MFCWNFFLDVVGKSLCSIVLHEMLSTTARFIPSGNHWMYVFVWVLESNNSKNSVKESMSDIYILIIFKQQFL